MGLHELLWDPLPDPLPAAGNSRQGWLAWLLTTLTAQPAEPRLPLEELVDRRVRRGAVQALVREAYQQTVAEQDSTRRKPDAFAQARRAHLAGFLDQATVDLHGWSIITIADLDVGLAWDLFEAASLARRQAVEHAVATPYLAVSSDRRNTGGFRELRWRVVGRVRHHRRRSGNSSRG